MSTNWFILLTSYFVVWWTVLFMVLPWSVQRDDNPAIGHDRGAPKQHRIGQKFLQTSLLSAVIWGVLFALAHYGAWDKLIEWIGDGQL